jgi:hypothetical protein
MFIALQHLPVLTLLSRIPFPNFQVRLSDRYIHRHTLLPECLSPKRRIVRGLSYRMSDLNCFRRAVELSN